MELFHYSLQPPQYCYSTELIPHTLHASIYFISFYKKVAKQFSLNVDLIALV